MKAYTNTPKQALNKAYRKEKVSRKEIDLLKRELPLLLDRIANPAESEENHKGHFQDFLKEVWYKSADCLVATKGKIDLVIHDGPKAKAPVGVMIEAKRKRNKAEMFSAAKPNVKSLHELVLYFLRERNEGNTGIKTLMITDGDETYLFPDREFERLFWEKKRFRNKVLNSDADGGKTNNTAYEIIKEHIETLDDTLHGTTFTISQFRKWADDGDPETDDNLIPLYKILSPPHLLRRPFANDSNKLDKGFYKELLHIIGLEEIGVDSKGKEKKNGGKKIIRRATGASRSQASLLENTWRVATEENRFRNVKGFQAYGSDEEDRQFAVALELCLTWVNRVLFLKLLESQLVAYHDGDQSFRFLTPERLPDYDALNTLFFSVLAKPADQRHTAVAQFAAVPYLNSSLFEITDLEDQVIRINSLEDNADLPLAPKSVLGTRTSTTLSINANFVGRAQKSNSLEQLQPLHYLFAFLDAYDFSSEGKARIQEENKRLINASVLGLIFEKINGYRDGSFYTPGFITEYMCRETIRRAVVQKFNDDTDIFAGFDSDSFDDLGNYLAANAYKTEVRKAANQLVNGLTVCDPAVGSGHFLVSALNELIATKSALGILGADAGAKAVDIKAVVENDELIVTDRHDEPYEYHVRTDANGKIRADELTQTIQETIFHEKRTLIENCLFGVDLNPNSVKICRLRLWIELLKHAYYQPGTGNLETLPNIDINIKQGNSLISRFALDDDLSGALGDSGHTLADYRQAVVDYHRATGKDAKDKLLGLIEEVKGNFRTHIGRNDKTLKKLAAARGKLTKLQGLLEMGDLFGSVDEKAVRKEMAPLEKQVAKLDAEVESVRSNAIYDGAFEWRFEFPRVLDEEGKYIGFDVIVGNPPYVRQEELTEIKPYLQKNYEVYAGTADLLVYFIELAMKNLRPNGQFSFIIANKFMRAGFGKALRRYIPQYRVRELLDFGDLPVFEEATTYPLIISLEKTAPTGEFTAANIEELYPKDFRASLEEVAFTSLQDGLTEDGWNLADVETQRLLDKLKNTGMPLGKYVNGEIYYGIKTGFNEAFVIDEETKNRLIAEDPKSAEIIKPFLAGRDVKRYLSPVAEKYLIFTRRGIDIEAYPAVKTHLNQYRKGLEPKPTDWKGAEWKGRKQGPYEWYEIQDSVNYHKEFEKLKVIIPSIVKEPSYSIDENGNYGNDKTTIMPISKDQYWLVALLNSSAVDFYLQSISSTKRGGYFEYKPVYISALPISEPNQDTQERLNVLAKKILTTKQTDPTADTSVLEGEIDLLVYRLYGLSFEEVKVVDETFGLSEEEYNAITHE